MRVGAVCDVQTELIVKIKYELKLRMFRSLSLGCLQRIKCMHSASKFSETCALFF